MKRVDTVITGIGIVSGLGLGKDENWANFCAGRSGIGPLRGIDARVLPAAIASQVPEERFADYLRAHFPRLVVKRTARFSQLCLAACRMAIEDGGLDLEREDRERIGIVVGNHGYGLKVVDEHLAHLVEERSDTRPSDWSKVALDPMAVPKLMANSCVAQASILYGLQGPSFTVGMSCASGAAAVALADQMLQLGRAEVALAGGADALVAPVPLIGFGAMGKLSRRRTEPEAASRPFDRERDGFVLGEAAGMIVLETAEHARRRRADVYARILGHATTCEAFSLTAPEPDGVGMAGTMTRAMRAAGVAPGDVDYVNAHAASTPIGDRCEALGVRRAFGARRLPVSSQKSMIGHTMGAAGAIEIAVTALTIKEGVVTPTINYEHPDRECDLDVVPNVAREQRVRIALSNSFGFGGHNCCVVLAADGRGH